MAELRVRGGAAGLRGLPLRPEEIPQIARALQFAALPTNDLGEPGLHLFAYEVGGQRIGFGGLELYGPDALVRSIVVDPVARGRGFGRKIVDLLAACARENGARTAYLLTTDKQEYFKRLGFATTHRDTAPTAIVSSRQMRDLCPASATLMRLELNH
jgi:N-acetylglutamate synthase-like GNAT family acetyltransferase